MECIASGVWRHQLGAPESVTPAGLCEDRPQFDALASLPPVPGPPIGTDVIVYRASPRGFIVEIPIDDSAGVEQFMGLGLQLQSLNHTGKKRTLRVNSDPVGDGDSHAPVPLLVSTAGYAIYVDTARYVTF